MNPPERIDATCTYCHLPIPRLRARPAVETAQPLYCCYGCRIAAEITGASGEEGHANWVLTRLGTAVVLSMAVMVFTLPMYSTDVFDAAAQDASSLAVQWTGVLRYAALLFTIPVFLLLGVPIISNAMEQLRAGTITTDVLIVMGVGAALIYSFLSTINDSGHTYFETVCMVLLLVTLGRYLETRGKVQASDAVMALEALIPDEVDVTRNGRRSRRKTSELEVGDLVHIPPGQTIPADGIVVDGNGYIDQQIVSGESALALKSVGDEMHAGTTSPDQAFTIRTTAVGQQSTVGRMAALLEEARRTAGRYELLADRVTAFFVPVIVTLALTAAWLGARANGLEEAIPRGLAVLLISCPCALGIATPMATWVALGRAATRGVLFRSGTAIETLARVRGVCIDKTGTLTMRTAQVCALETGPASGATRRDLIAIAAGLSQTSRHVLAESIAQYAQQEHVKPVAVKDAKAVPGLGMEGHIDGDVVRVGSLSMLEGASVRFASHFREYAVAAMETGHSIACVALNDNAAGVFTFTEQLRPEAKEAITRLRELGCEIQVLTGDHRARGAALSAELGIYTVAELSPTQKIDEITKLRRRARSVAMIGDGLNDAPALVAADIGIAMGCGADISRDSADICLLGDDLTGVPWSIRLARRTVRTIKTNLFWAFAYNACCVPLAMAGILNPVVAAMAMVVSSLFVVTNSARLSKVPLHD